MSSREPKFTRDLLAFKNGRPLCHLCYEPIPLGNLPTFAGEEYGNTMLPLFCSEDHLRLWKGTMEAASIRLEVSVNRFLEILMKPVLKCLRFLTK